jgi:hypothetical protein
VVEVAKDTILQFNNIMQSFWDNELSYQQFKLPIGQNFLADSFRQSLCDMVMKSAETVSSCKGVINAEKNE